MVGWVGDLSMARFVFPSVVRSTHPLFYPHTSTKCVHCIYKQPFGLYSFFIPSCRPFTLAQREKQKTRNHSTNPIKKAKLKKKKEKVVPFLVQWQRCLCAPLRLTIPLIASLFNRDGGQPMLLTPNQDMSLAEFLLDLDEIIISYFLPKSTP